MRALSLTLDISRAARRVPLRFLTEARIPSSGPRAFHARNFNARLLSDILGSSLVVVQLGVRISWPGTAPASHLPPSPGGAVLGPRMSSNVTAMLPHCCGETRNHLALCRKPDTNCARQLWLKGAQCKLSSTTKIFRESPKLVAEVEGDPSRDKARYQMLLRLLADE